MQTMKLSNGQLLQLVRSYSKKHDPLMLSNALELLSPSKSAENYKPSLLRHFQKGSISEYYDEIKSDLLPKFHIPKTDHSKQIGNLMEDLHAAVGMLPRQSNIASKNRNVNSVASEDELLDLIRLYYYQGELSPQLLTQLLLNKHLRNLNRLPFDVENMSSATFKGKGWTPIHYVQFKILLMKKHHDLDNAEEITNILDLYFLLTFLRHIVRDELLPMYERVVWKFVFSHVDHYNETQVIEELDCLRSSVLIWEASHERNRVVAEKILTYHTLAPLLRTFFEVASCDPVQNTIIQEFKSSKSNDGNNSAIPGNSPTLSKLKKISTKSKIYNFDNVNTAIGRALAYSIDHNLTQFLATQLAENGECLVFQKYLKILADERSTIVGRNEPLDNKDYDKVYTD